MTRRSTPLLRVAPPTLEPGPVLLHQLTELSASSSPSVRTARYAGVRALAGAATVAVIGATTWVAGAAPGSDGVGPAARSSHEAAGVPTPGGTDVGTPQSDVQSSAPGSSWSPELPGTEPSVEIRVPNAPGEQPPNDHPGKGSDHGQGGKDGKGGKGDGTGNGQGRGHAYGHLKTPPGQNHNPPGQDQTPPGHDNKPAGHKKESAGGKGHGTGHSNGHGKANGHDKAEKHGKGKSKGHGKRSHRGGGRR